MYSPNINNLIQNEIDLGRFQLKVVNVREESKKLCQEYRIKFEEHMTPNEELYKRLFAEGKTLVKDMDDLQLRAHRQEMGEIAFKARAFLHAADDAEQERTKKNKKFNAPVRNLEQDEISSNAIDAIKTRKERLSKTDKAIENLAKLPGMTREMAEAMYAPKKLVEVRDRKVKEPLASTEDIVNAIVGADKKSSFVEGLQDKDKEKKPFVNPFLKKN